MSISIKEFCFGRLTDGQIVKKYTLTNKNNFELNIISYGASIQSILLNDRNGKQTNVALGFETIEGKFRPFNKHINHKINFKICSEYCKSSPYFGSTVGRVANRISNAEFSLDGTKYSLDKNNGKHCLHGGSQGIAWKNWASDILPDATGVKFTYVSADGEGGFPGKLKIIQYFILKYMLK